MNDILRVVLPAYLLAFFAIAFAWRSYLVWKRTGINPYVVGRSDRPIDFVENLYPFPAILLLATTLLYAVLPGVYSLTAPITWLEGVSFRITGLVLMAVALVWTATAQMQMGSSWRIGIDLVNKTDLVEKGLFRVTRNPIFLGMEEYDRLLTERTKIVAVAHVSNSLGTVNPVKEIVATAHKFGVPVLVDAAQSIPHFPVDVQDIDCDFLAFSGHKMFGPTGSGILYGKRQWLDQMPPYETGGGMLLYPIEAIKHWQMAVGVG